MFTKNHFALYETGEINVVIYLAMLKAQVSVHLSKTNFSLENKVSVFIM